MRIVLLRPPGSDGKSLALTLVEVEHLQNVVPISVGDLIDNEIIKRSAYGKEIEKNRKNFSYVSDEIVIELLKLKVEECEREQRSYIIEGFPRTEVQAIAMQRMGILPDYFILLN